MKIGRNDKCPCGSGKKYKKCCIGTMDKIINRKHLWTKSEVERQSNDEIIDTLRMLGVRCTLEAFSELTTAYFSAEDLSESWFDNFEIDVSGLNEDYFWLAAWVLWERDQNVKWLCDESVDTMIEKGYALWENRPEEAVEPWMNAWKEIQLRYTDATKLEKFETLFKGDASLFNWIQDFDELLSMLQMHKERIAYCKAFIERFSMSKDNIIREIRKSLAETYFALGEKEMGDRQFEELITDYPEWTWGYIGWADVYDEFRENKEIEENLTFVKEILDQARPYATDELSKRVIEERLMELGNIKE